MMRTSDIILDRESGIPLYLQIAGAIRSWIQTGQLSSGSKLPSTRAVAERLVVQRKTVVQAFSVLREEGWVAAGVGQGTFVLESARPRRSSVGSRTVLASETNLRGALGSADDSGAESRQPGEGPESFSWDAILPNSERPDDRWQFWLRNVGPDDAIRFTGATADPEHFPMERFQGIVNEVLDTQGARAFDYGPAAGYLPLREWLAARLTQRGIEADPERVLIVNGSQQGLDLIARLLVREGDRVLVEEPSYSNGFRLLQSHGAEVDGVHFDAGGIEVDSLERACGKGSARLLYTMPLFQNPTGMVLAEDRIEPILDLCWRHQVPIVEDNFDADLFYTGEPPVPIAARDRRSQVILVGTFSKILFPGLRLGWMLVPRALLRAVHELKQMTDLSTGLLAQQSMHLYCERGLLDEHLIRVREINGRRLQTLLGAMERELPPEMSWTRPRGGMTLWAKLPPGVDSLSLLETARSAGVEFSPGPFFFPNSGGSEFLRLGYVRETEERIRQGIALLGAAIRDHIARAPGRSTPRPFL